MNIIRRTIDIDAAVDARLTAIAAERGQNLATVLADAVALLDSVVRLDEPDIAEDRRRLDAFHDDRLAIPLEEAKAWVTSWDTPDERPRPQPRKIG